MFATAAIDTGSATKAILVPEEAVVLIQGVPTVFVEDADFRTRKRLAAGTRLPPMVLRFHDRIDGAFR